MRQVLQSAKHGAIEVAEVPAPTVRPGGVLVRTEASALSVGTERTLGQFANKSLLGKAASRPDLVRQVLRKAARDGWRSAWGAVQTQLASSFPLGYSSAGTVIAVGDEHSPFRVGDRVACGGGGYATHAEVAFVPYNLCAPVSPDVPAEHAAFATIGAVALHGLRLGRTEVGGSVAVIGLGIVGQLAVQLARSAGCRVVAIDVDATRVSLATALGADAGVVIGEQDALQVIGALTNDVGVDAALITAGTPSNDPLVLAAQCCRDHGRVVAVGAVGLEVPRKLFFQKEIELVVSRSYGPGRYDPLYEEHGIDYPIGYVRWTEQRNLVTFLQLAATNVLPLHRLITHRFPLTDAAKAYQLISGTGERFLGVILTYPPAGPSLARSIAITAPAARRSTARLGIGVIGAGQFARQILLPRLARTRGAHLTVVASAGGVSAVDAAREFGFERAATGPDEVLSAADVDLVVIETRHNLHAAIAVQAIEAGKAVFVEKPLALSEEDLHRVAEAWARAGRPPATVGFNRRRAPMIDRVRRFQAARQGPWMIALRINAGSVPSTSWVVDPEVGGGRLIGEGCHFVDLAQHLVNAAPVEVFAAGGAPDEAIRQGDSATTIRFADGSVASIVYATRGSKIYGKERVEIVGGEAMAILDDYRVLELVDGKRKTVERNRWDQDKGHAAYLDAFLASIVEGKPFAVDFRDLLLTSLATIRVVDSLRQGTPQPVGGPAFLANAGIG